MHFTPEILRQHARILVEKEVKKNRDILAVYLRGSLLYGSPLLGGAGDIDLVFIHNGTPELDREIRKLTPEIFFDIENHDQMLYQTPRELRLDPWFGPTLRDALPLHDPRHLLDYTQSGVRSNFDFPENVQARSQKLLDQARGFWLDRQVAPPKDLLNEIPAFLSALENAVNAVALLSGPPLTLRRLGQDFPNRAEKIGAPGLNIAFEHLLGTVNQPKALLVEWLGDWEQAIKALKDSSAPRSILAEQEVYFKKSLEELIENSSPSASLWPLFNTWTTLIACQPNLTRIQTPWIKALTSLGFAGKDYQVRLAAFDSFLELCETLVNKETEGLG